ncbi:MAG: hypothetical protein ABIT83_10705 [Massilia sp.]
MYSTKFDTLIDEFPEESAAVGRLLELIREGEARPGRKEYLPNRLYDVLQPSNYRVLVSMLSSAVDKGLLKRSFRVISSVGGGIGDFDSILDIPVEIYDSRTGRSVNVSPDSIELVFFVKP